MKKFFTFLAVAAMAFAAQAAQLTVCDGVATSEFVPIYGIYYDTQNTTAQMIYPADMLTDMKDGKITELRFFSARVFDSRLSDGTLQLSLKVVDQDRFAEEGLDVITGALAVASTSPVTGETELVFTLDEPFEYTGGNLLVETLVTDAGGIRTTEFYGIETDYISSMYKYVWATWSGPSINPSHFLPKAMFTFDKAELPETAAPSIDADIKPGVHAYYVTITESEPSDLYYRYSKDNGEWTEWLLYDGVVAFEEDGYYQVEAYAIADGKSESETVDVSFIVTPRTGLDEIAGEKAVAAVRYYNVAGQEMQQAQGLTIVVTTYSDGTSSTVKVMK